MKTNKQISQHKYDHSKLGLARRARRHKANLARGKVYRDGLKILVFTHYSKGRPKCNCCREKCVQFLSIDHIKGDGAAHRRKVSGGARLYKWLRDNGFPKGYQVLCFNCNFAKHAFGACPHKKGK